MKQSKYSDITESNIHSDVGNETSMENSVEIYFCPTAGDIKTKDGLMWHITHVHIKYSNQPLPTAFEHCCSDKPAFHPSTTVTILPWPWAFPSSAFHPCTAGTDCSGCTKISREEIQPCTHTFHWAQCPAHGSWERLGSRSVWMVLLIPLPARGWVRYGEWGAKLFKNPTPKHGMSQPCYTFVFCESANQEWITHVKHG